MKKENEKGTLYIVGTPIGNLGDITLRALEVLKTVDLIAAEDTRRTRKLLSHFGIHTSLTSFHEYTKQGKVKALVEKLKSGISIAMVTDAGTPGVSDPGSWFIHNVRVEEIPVIPIPGVSALTTAISVSQISCNQFVFLGFLPYKKKKREDMIQSMGSEGRVFIFFESPYRLKGTIEDLARLLPGHLVCITRELTKIHEEIQIDFPENILQAIQNRTPKGEYTVVVGHPPKNLYVKKTL